MRLSSFSMPRGPVDVGRHVVVGHRHGLLRRADLAAGHPQPLEGLRARDLVDEVAVDVDQAGAVRRLVHQVGVPESCRRGFSAAAWLPPARMFRTDGRRPFSRRRIARAPARGSATAGGRGRPCRKPVVIGASLDPNRPRRQARRRRLRSPAPPAQNSGAGRIAPAGAPRRLRIGGFSRRAAAGWSAAIAPSRDQQRDDGAFRGPGRAVLDLERHAEAALGQDRDDRPPRRRS